VHLDDLARVADEGSQAAEFTGKAREELAGITATFQSLLQLAQVEGGQAKARFSPVDLTVLCQTIAEVFEPSAAEHGHTLTLAVPDRPVKIDGDKALLGQMLSNLIENALRHTPQGTDVTLSLTTDAMLTVADTGPGIPEAEREKVLQRLYRLDRSRHTPGNGLGLSLVEAVASLHGAKVTLADNTPGLRVRVAFH
jgi:signal transduction histidine kinase